MSDQDSGPKPGHFLPGGAGDASAEPESSTKAQRLPHLTKPESVGPSADTGHLGQRSYGRKDIRRDAPAAQPPRPGRQVSKAAIVGLIVVTLALLSGGVFGAVKLIGTFGALEESSQPAPSTRPPTAPVSEPSPTVTVVAPEPDYDRIVKKNKIYAAGRLAPSRCKEPGFRPTSKQNVQKFYQGMIACLNKSWEPAVRKAGFEFRGPKLVLYEGVAEDKCGDYSTTAFYCQIGEGIYLPWRDDVKDYKAYPIATRVGMADTVAHEFGHHVQFLTGILDAAQARGYGGVGQAALEESRRLELQASCFAAVYLGANKNWFPLTGDQLDAWNYRATHRGDENDPGEGRTHGSRKSNVAWLPPAFKSTTPGSCNTYTAPAAKVS